MKSIVILWIVVLSILLLLAISKKNPVSQARATVVETDCLNVVNAHPCTVSVEYKINGATYTQKMGVKPSSNTLIGKNLTIGYHPRFPLQIQEYKSHLNPFTIPAIVWFFLGLAVLYFAYDPIRIRPVSEPVTTSL
jgi:hypothetical protein